MSQPLYLVCHETRQCVHVAEAGGFGFRGADNSTIVGVFCEVHIGKALCVLGPDGLEGAEKALPQGEAYVEWTTESFKEPLRVLMGDERWAEQRIHDVLSDT